MRALIQRVKMASVSVEGESIAQIAQGFLIFLGLREGDGQAELSCLVKKTLKLRIFSDPAGKMNLSLGDISASVLVVSQFTLYADARQGNRPSFIQAMAPERAEPLYLDFVEALRAQGLHVETGRFAADMDVSLVNDGPVTILLEAENGKLL